MLHMEHLPTGKSVTNIDTTIINTIWKAVSNA